jgi:hypothetical protein
VHLAVVLLLACLDDRTADTAAGCCFAQGCCLVVAWSAVGMDARSPVGTTSCIGVRWMTTPWTGEVQWWRGARWTTAAAARVGDGVGELAAELENRRSGYAWSPGLDRCCLGQLGLEFGSMGLALRQFGYSLYSGTGLLNPNFPIKFRVPEGSTQISFRFFRVRVFWVRVRVFRDRDSGIGFSAESWLRGLCCGEYAHELLPTS